MEDTVQHTRCHLCLVVMCGLPGAGKTTLTQKLVRNSELLNFECTCSSESANSASSGSIPKDQHILLVQFDEIIPRELPINSEGTARLDTNQRNNRDGHGDKNEPSTTWKKYRQAIHSAIEKLLNGITNSNEQSGRVTEKSLQNILTSTNDIAREESTIDRKVIQEIKDAISRQNWSDAVKDTRQKQEEDCGCFVLILDDNMFYRSMRFEYYQLARKYGTGFAQIHMQCSVSVALRRNEVREHSVAMETIINMESNLEVPDPIKAPWEDYTAVIDAEKQTNDEDMIRIWCVVKQALANPAPPYQEIDTTEQEESRKVSLASVIHQADVMLRKSVAEIMKANKSQNQASKQQLQQLARTLNSLKTDILNDIRHKKIDVPPLALSEDGERQEIQTETFNAFIKELFQARMPDSFKNAKR